MEIGCDSTLPMCSVKNLEMIFQLNRTRFFPVAVVT